MTNPTEQNEEIANKFKIISDKYHKMSLLFYELSQSLSIEAKHKNTKEFKEYIQSLNLDINKIKKITKVLSELDLNDLKGGIKE